MAGVYLHVVAEANFAELNGDIRPIVRELMDQLFQTSGESHCTWFAPSGEFNGEAMRAYLSQPLIDQIKQPSERE